MKCLWTTILGAMLAFSGALAGEASVESAEQPRIRAEIDVAPTVSVTDDEQRVVYIVAGRVLTHIDRGTRCHRYRGYRRGGS